MNNPVFVYLAGPIYGCTHSEAKDWRKDVAAQLAQHGITAISPLRCEPHVGERYDLSYADPAFGAARSILAKNFLDLQRADFVLVYFPPVSEPDELRAIADKVQDSVGFVFDEDNTADTLRRIANKGPQRSVGTIGELSWAYALRKPVCVVSEDPFAHGHPFIAEQPNWPVMSNMNDAVRLITGLFSAYATGVHNV